MAKPTAQQVKAFREQVQRRQQSNITAAQDVCAAMLYVPRRTWQKWEADERQMHCAMWDLAQRKQSELSVDTGK